MLLAPMAHIYTYIHTYIELWSWDSSVGVANRYKLDDPEIQSRSRTALGPIQLPIQWGTGLSLG
jgi:hypothetical protein